MAAIRVAITQFDSVGGVLSSCTTMIDDLPKVDDGFHRIISPMWNSAARYAEFTWDVVMKPVCLNRPLT